MGHILKNLTGTVFKASKDSYSLFHHFLHLEKLDPYRATGLDVVILKEEMGSRGKMGFLARLA